MFSFFGFHYILLVVIFVNFIYTFEQQPLQNEHLNGVLYSLCHFIILFISTVLICIKSVSIGCLISTNLFQHHNYIPIQFLLLFKIIVFFLCTYKSYRVYHVLFGQLSYLFIITMEREREK